MKVGGTFLFWGIIVVVFFRWYAEQEKHDAATPPAGTGRGGGVGASSGGRGSVHTGVRATRRADLGPRGQ